ncbi:MAG: type II toxin-antitoxin system Phd/YefM family antitoxin [Myxococcales bacterium]|nr:type II toxin-antitoxin system Phd/YefM family antitoxin [Myxococcales bacterium]
MKRYTASQARQHLSDLLDAAAKGEAVVIERGGVRFRLQAEKRARLVRRRRSRVELIDPAVEAGSWTWSLGAEGLRFRPRRR